MIAPGCDAADVGESWSCFQWVRGVADYADVTLLTMKRGRQEDVSRGLGGVEVVSWPELKMFQRYERFSSIVKPAYCGFYLQARKWIKESMKAGRSWDLAHQVGPIALRYPSPACGLGLNLVLGPQAGSLETPQAFRSECARMPWYVKLRMLDRLRLRFDPALRQTYKDASLVLGVAPYVHSLLGDLGIRKFVSMSETGVSELRPAKASGRHGDDNVVRLLYAGRLVRTKGLRDAIRALGIIKQRNSCEKEITLDVAGAGEEEAQCIEEAKRLGVENQICFHGRLERNELHELFQSSDVFVFPSFREPSGNVVFEALQHGLPVITSDRGGPGYVINEQCGVRLSVDTPEQYAGDLADAIEKLAVDDQLRNRLAAGATNRIRDVGLWPRKIQRLISQYQEITDLSREAFEPKVCA